jgi:hypothetical protein
MRRALFAREFRSALVPNLATVGAILGTLMVLERLYGSRLGKAEDIRAFSDAALLAGLILSGFISGERCFPTEMKESRSFFLSSLPISRTWVWLAIVSARLLAALTSLSLAIALRRPSLVLPDSRLLRLNVGLVAALIVFGYILFFATGTLFALLFRRTLFSYAVGFPALGILLTETLLSSSYLTAFPNLMFGSLGGISDSLPHVSVTIFLSLLLVLMLLWSWRLFVRGEINNPKRRMSNQLLCGATAAVYLGFMFCVSASPSLASAGSFWSTGAGFFPQAHGIPYSVSPDGRYLVVFETSIDRTFLFRVNILDTQTGHVTGRSVLKGVNCAYWSNRGDVLNLVVLNDSPLDRWGYLTPATVDWVRLSTKAREISRQRLPGIQQLEVLEGGRGIAVLQEGDEGRVVLLDGASGRLSQVMRAPFNGRADIQPSGSEALVYFDNVGWPRRAWAVNSRARELRTPRSIPEISYALFGEVLGSPAEAQAALFRRFSSPSSSEGAPIHGEFLLPKETWILDSDTPSGLYFLSGESVWARSTAPNGHWKKLPDLPQKIVQSIGDSFDALKFIDFASGMSTFTFASKGADHLFVYDPLNDVTFQGDGCSPPSISFSEISHVPNLTPLIKLTCSYWKNRLPTRVKVGYFVPSRGSQGLRAVKAALVPWSPRPMDLYLDERGWGVQVRLGQGDSIVRSSPGMSDLILWPHRGATAQR